MYIYIYLAAGRPKTFYSCKYWYMLALLNTDRLSRVYHGQLEAYYLALYHMATSCPDQLQQVVPNRAASFYRTLASGHIHTPLYALDL